MMSSWDEARVLKFFSEFITAELGLYFPPERWQDLKKSMVKAAEVFKCDNSTTCMQWLMASPLDQQQIETLAAILTIGETYFFREPAVFHVLKNKILAPLIQQRRQQQQFYLRIWSAGCASGEEAYSIAITLQQLLSDIEKWNITILATDINTVALKKLIKGVYTPWSFRGVDAATKHLYFSEIAPNQYEIKSSLKQLVKPVYLNLARDTYPSLNNYTNAVDVIFCRNVLMYFSPQIFQAAIARLYRCLVNQGCLFLSSTESCSSFAPDMTIEKMDEVSMIRKNPAVLSTPHHTSIAPVSTSSPKLAPVVAATNFEALAERCANQGDLQQALVWNSKAINHAKLNPHLYYMRAMILIELNQVSEAITALQRVIYLNPSHVLAYVSLSQLFVKLNKPIDANKQSLNAMQLLAAMDPTALIGDIPARRLLELMSAHREIE